MKLALFGYGKMNRLVETLATASGHQIGVVVQSNGVEDEAFEKLKSCEVAIDFSISDAVLPNVETCMKANVKLVEGTTGWLVRQPEVERAINKHNGAAVYSANFSIGVNLFYRIVKQAAEAFAGIEGYDVFLEEAHHRQKRDAPSGTALHLKKIIDERLHTDVEAVSLRAGFIPGTHIVGFDSIADTITLTHTARSREGFARGALYAAEWLAKQTDVKGLIEFEKIFD